MLIGRVLLHGQLNIVSSFLILLEVISCLNGILSLHRNSKFYLSAAVLLTLCFHFKFLSICSLSLGVGEFRFSYWSLVSYLSHELNSMLSSYLLNMVFTCTFFPFSFSFSLMVPFFHSFFKGCFSKLLQRVGQDMFSSKLISYQNF